MSNERRQISLNFHTLVKQIEQATGLDLGNAFRVSVDAVVDQPVKLYIGLYSDDRLDAIEWNALQHDSVERFMRTVKRTNDFKLDDLINEGREAYVSSDDSDIADALRDILEMLENRK